MLTIDDIMGIVVILLLLGISSGALFRILAKVARNVL